MTAEDIKKARRKALRRLAKARGEYARAVEGYAATDEDDLFYFFDKDKFRQRLISDERKCMDKAREQKYLFNLCSSSGPCL